MKTAKGLVCLPIVVSLIALCVVGSPAWAATNRYVWASSPNPGTPFTTWSNAAHTIQEAVDVANAGDTVWVTNGVYASGGQPAPGSKLVNRIFVDKPITVRGHGQRSRTVVFGQSPTNLTGTVGDGAARCLYMNQDAHVSGFTFTNGYTRSSDAPPDEQRGGGVYMPSGGTLSNCVVTGCKAYQAGGVHFGGTVVECTISDNESVGSDPSFSVGGVYSATGTLRRSVISGNEGYMAGGLYADGGAVEQCAIKENRSSHSGGGAMLAGATMRDCLVSGNRASGFISWGGGVHASTLSTISGCTIASNVVNRYGGGVYSAGSSWTNCIIRFNEVVQVGFSDANWYVDTNQVSSFAYTCTPNTNNLPGGTGCTTNDPQFENRQAGDLHLKYTSACVDAGTTNPPVAEHDLEMIPRVLGKTVNMGCYEQSRNSGLPAPQPRQPGGGDKSGNSIMVMSFAEPTRTLYYSSKDPTWVDGTKPADVYTVRDNGSGGFITNDIVQTLSGTIWSNAVPMGGVSVGETNTVEYRNADSNLVDIGTDAAFVDIVKVGAPDVTITTFMPYVTYDMTEVSVGGASAYLVGTMWITNELTGASDTFAANASWTVPSVALSVGTNRIVVGGVSAYAEADQDAIDIVRGGPGTGVPIVTVTNTPADLPLSTTTFSPAGVANSNVVGTMWAMNLMNASTTSFAASTSWTAPPVDLEPGANEIRIYGLNLTGTVVYDTAWVWQHGGWPNAYVATNGTHVFPYTNWTTAATNIQTAVDAVEAGGTVWVSNGVYRTGGWPAPGCQSRNRVMIRQPMTVQSMNGREKTFIEGAYDPLSGAWGADAVRGVCITTNATLIGFTITNGWTRDSGDYRDTSGGGVLCTVPDAIIWQCTVTASWSTNHGGGAFGGTLRECTVSDNWAAKAGGGTYGSALDDCTVSGNITDGNGGGVHGGSLVNCTVNDNAAVVSGGGVYDGDVTGGTISSNSAEYGGGVFCGETTTVDDCLIIDNIAGGGGGVGFPGLGLGKELNNCTLSRNIATIEGGGVSLGTLNNCTLSGNTAGRYGGGAFFSTLNNCTLIGNEAGDSGGGASGSTLNNCVLAGNRATSGGGGASHSDLDNCTVSRNVGDPGAGVNICSLDNCIVWGNEDSFGVETNIGGSVSAKYSCSPDLLHGAGGNTTNDPVFVSVATTNLRLQANSPCIDAGTNMPWMAGATDLDGHPRIGGDRVDMGAYEAWHDDFNNATALSGAAGSESSDTTDATDEFQERAHAGQGPAKSVWWKWTQPADDLLTINTFGSEFDTVLGIYTGATLNALVEVASNDDSLGEHYYQSIVTTRVHKAVTYYAAVDGYLGTNGSVTLNWRFFHDLAVLITNPVGTATGTYDLAGYSLQGTNNEYIVGTMRITNALNGASGTFPASSPWWAPDISLDVGTNVVSVYGTNAFGHATSDSVEIVRGIAGTGFPWIDITNSPTSFTYDTTTMVMAGYASSNVMGTMWATNALTGEKATFAASASWSSSAMALAVGSNPITVYGTNLVGQEASATTNIVRGGIGTGLPHVYIAGEEAEVETDVTSYAVTGSNNLHVAGTMVVSNRFTMVWQTFPAATNWTAPGMALMYGPNEITVSGSNALGQVATDMICVNRLLPAETYVSTNGAHVFPYTNWTTAATNIQAAVYAVRDDGTVWVTNGIYDTGGAMTPEYSLMNRVLIARPMTVCSVNGRDETFIVGAPDPVTGSNGTDAVRGVCILTNATLSGFTVTNGHTQWADYIYDVCGGGVFCEEGSGAVVSNCTLSGNSAYGGGGSYEGTLNKCTLSGNWAWDGGGSYEGTLNKCTLLGNTAAGDGGGSFGGTLNDCTLSGNSAGYVLNHIEAYGGGGSAGGTLNNCTLTGNSGGEGGGSSGGTLNNCMLSGNLARDGGGSLYAALNNCTLWGNTATNEGGGSYRGTLNNCIVWNNTAMTSNDVCEVTARYSCSPDLGHGSKGNITNDPQFVSLGSITNLHLLPGSPCINVGSNALVVGSVDLDGNARILYGRVDMGAYEFVTDTHYAATNGAHVSPYATWENAATTIQHAVDVALAGSDVLVAAGRYDQGGAPQPGRLLTNRVMIAKAVAVRSVVAPEHALIVGQPDPTSGTNGPGAVRCVYMTNGAELAGFTLTNGYTDVWPSFPYEDSGGGALLDGGGVVSNCYLVSNMASADGGGVMCYNGGVVRNSRITGNRAVGKGGGAICYYGGTLDRCAILDNVAGKTGGGVDSPGLAVVRNCLVAGNEAGHHGGGIGSGGGSAGKAGLVQNCTVVDNWSADKGGGIASDASNINCIIYHNLADVSGDNWVQLNGGVFEYLCTTPLAGLPSGVECTDGLPRFVNRSAGDYHLLYGSAAIDSATASGVPGVDLDGVARPIDGDLANGAEFDMGAFEYDPWRTDSDGDGVIDGVEVVTHGTSPTNTNTDGDPHDDGQEVEADTDGTDSNDFFRITGITIASPVTIYFESSSNRMYDLLGSSNLLSGAWTNVPGGTKQGVGGADTVQDTNVPPSGPYYRLNVRP